MRSQCQKHGKHGQKLIPDKKLYKPLNCLVGKFRPLLTERRDSAEVHDVDEKNAQQGKPAQDVNDLDVVFGLNRTCRTLRFGDGGIDRRFLRDH